MMDFDEIVVKESPGLCRCCLSEGCYKDLGTEYTWMNETEVYADILLECFDISITQHNEGPNGPNRLICEVCITRLRDACNFKKQVMDSERKFIDIMGRGEFRPKMLFYQAHLKCEDSVPVEEPIEDTAVEYLEDDADFDDDDELKEELAQPSVSEVAVAAPLPKGKRGRPRKTTPAKSDKRAKVAKADDKGKTSKAVAKATKGNVNTKPCLDEETQRRSCKLFMDILETSTALPFRNNTIRYRCFYCPTKFKLISQLRKHTLNNHMNEDSKHIVKENITNSILKLDISELQCKICSEDFEDIDAFIVHLQTHKLKVNYDLTHILTFKLSDERVSCFTCKEEFTQFYSLFEHTQRAHTNGTFPCENCDRTFCTKNSLARHTGKEHKMSHYGCDLCGKKFYSNLHKMHHIRRMHEIENRKCPVCYKILGSSYQKSTHLARVHDVWATKYKCNLCPRTFLKKDMLSKHVRREHFKEKNVTCEVCGQRFFDQHLLESHQVKHETVRPFSCAYCNKTFTRKKALDVHTRIHTNDKRCVCKECGKAFVQCASLHWHMRVHHNQNAKETDVAAEELTDVGEDD